MAKLRKMLGSAEAPYIISLMRLIETQSKQTLAAWCNAYASNQILQIYEEACPGDSRPRTALQTAKACIEGNSKLDEVKKAVRELRVMAKEAEGQPVAQAAIRAMEQAVSTVYHPTGALSIAFYASAAIAYHKVGLAEKPEIYDAIAAWECAKIEASLKAVSVENESNPVKIKWTC